MTYGSGMIRKMQYLDAFAMITIWLFGMFGDVFDWTE